MNLLELNKCEKDFVRNEAVRHAQHCAEATCRALAVAPPEAILLDDSMGYYYQQRLDLYRQGRA